MSYSVMAGLVPAIHDLLRGDVKKDVDARVKPTAVRFNQNDCSARQ